MRHDLSLRFPILSLAPLALLGALACGSAAPGEDVGENGGALSGNNVTAISTISYAPNSFVIGNAYPGWTDLLRGSEVWGQGPGNESGSEYRCGYLYGESFDHCGWLGKYAVGGSSGDDACGSDCPSSYEDATVFKPVYTNGNICSKVDEGGVCNTFMNWLAPECTDRNAYGNVGPWKAEATPDNLVEEVPHQRYLQWRYVSHDGQWVMVMDPSKDGSKTQPNWYFVSSHCVDVAGADAPEPPALSSGASSAGSGSGSSSSSSASPPPATSSSTPPPAPHCCAKCNDRTDAYHADSDGEACGKAADTFCSINGRGGVEDWFEGDCPEAP